MFIMNKITQLTDFVYSFLILSAFLPRNDARLQLSRVAPCFTRIRDDHASTLEQHWNANKNMQ
jgi:hypothetical protein